MKFHTSAPELARSCLKVIKRLGKSKALIVTDAGLVKFGVAKW